MRIKRISHDVGKKIAGSAIWMMGVGVVMTIWGGVWLAYLFNEGIEAEAMYFVAAGVLLSGLDLGAIGFFSGRISRHAEAEEEEVDEGPPHGMSAAGSKSED